MGTFIKGSWMPFFKQSTKRLYDVTAVFSETIVRKRSHNVLSARHYRRFHSNAISFFIYRGNNAFGNVF